MKDTLANKNGELNDNGRPWGDGNGRSGCDDNGCLGGDGGAGMKGNGRSGGEDNGRSRGDDSGRSGCDDDGRLRGDDNGRLGSGDDGCLGGNDKAGTNGNCRSGCNDNGGYGGDDNCQGGNDDSRRAKERLLDSAEKLFSQNGFESTTVRQIVKDADCNIAAVNYHFGVKVFHRRMDYMRERRVRAINEFMEKPSPELEELLRVFADAFIEPLVEGHKGRFFINLMLREMINPRLGFESFFREVIAPVTMALQKAFMDVCPKLDSDKAMGCVQSFIAQLLHLLHHNKNSDDFTDKKAVDISKGIGHVIEFTMAGIRHFAEGGE